MRKISEKIVSALVKNDSYWNKKRDALVYTFEFLLNKVFMMFLIIIFSVITNTLIESAILFLSMTYFRNKFSGFHFDKFYKCIIFSMVLFCFSILVTLLIPIRILNVCFYFIILINFLLLLLIANNLDSDKVATNILLLFFITILAILYNVFISFLFLIELALLYSLLMYFITFQSKY